MPESENIMITGRVFGKRAVGKNLIFLDIKRDGDYCQIVLNKRIYHDDFNQCHEFSLGDIAEFVGTRGISKAGERSLMVKTAKLLAPCSRHIPHKLNDPDIRIHDRSLDMLVNPHVIRNLKTRALIIKAIRNFLHKKGFDEIETPIISALAGGANAKPFITHINALDAPAQLRISPELYLKQLIVGGFEKVFEIGKQFRNEGIDPTHSPEFTSCEFYQTYTTLENVMELTQELFKYILLTVHGKTELELESGVKIDFSKDFQILDINQELKQLGLTSFTDKDQLLQLANDNGIIIPKPQTIPRILDHLISKLIETKCIQPTFLYGHPIQISPLAKAKGHDNIADRFELFINGKEYVNAYTELNDPDEQRARFAEQELDKAKGDEEAQSMDESFCKALELGLPPTVGWGLGIDRLVMLLTNSKNIREVIAFPMVDKTNQ